MGSCISKCRSKKKFKEDHSLVHDKLVISQAQVSFNNPQITDRPVSPAPSSVSSVSFSSFSCSNGGPSNGSYSMVSSLSSTSSSSASTALCTKDRSFSNEFLYSCVKENPHVIGLNQTKKSFEKSAVYSRIQPQNNFQHSVKPVAEPVLKKTILQEIHLDEMVQQATPKKRARASSPTIIRQKSFRKEQNSASSNCNRGLMRSPSPSRRFSGDNNMSRTTPTNVSKNGSCRNSSVITRANTNISSSCCRKRENSRPQTASPSHDLSRRNTAIMGKRGVINQQINAKHDDISTGEECNQRMDIDSVMEDIHNPHIALDCFIFL